MNNPDPTKKYNEEESIKVWNDACAECANDGQGECKVCNFMGILDSHNRCKECTGFLDDYDSNYPSDKTNQMNKYNKYLMIGFCEYKAEEITEYFKKFLIANKVPQSSFKWDSDNEMAYKYKLHNETIDILVEKINEGFYGLIMCKKHGRQVVDETGRCPLCEKVIIEPLTYGK